MQMIFLYSITMIYVYRQTSIDAFEGPTNDPEKLICPIAAADEHCTYIYET